MNSVTLLCTLVVLLCCVALASAHSALDHQCVYDMMHPPKYTERWMSTKTKRNAQPIPYASDPPASATNSQPIRIKFDYSNIQQTSFNEQWTCFDGISSVSLYGYPNKVQCTDDLKFNSSRQANMMKFLQDAEAILTETLSVIPVDGTLNLNGYTQQTPCGHNEFQVPSDYYTVGKGSPDTDLIILIGAHPGPRANDGTILPVIAFGISCVLDQNNRPILGMLNFVPTYLDSSADDYNTRLYTAVHEITHVLGFNSGTFAALGMFGTDTDNHYADDSLATFNVINSTKVTQYTQTYFGCNQMKGAPIEDNGGSGTAGSHWKKRVFMDEYMIGNAINTPIFSELSLAWFEDTGFYVANYTNAQRMEWGRGQGCDFVKKKCADWNSDYICTQGQNTDFGCSADMKQKSQCQVAQVTLAQDVPSIFQYFADNVTGPSDALQDYCPIPVPLYACSFSTAPGSFSKISAFTDAIDRGEQNGFTDARCFSSTVVKGIATGAPKAPTCYRTYCTSPGTLKVLLNEIWYDCPAGQDIEVIIYSGKISCPDSIARVCGGAPVDNTWPVWTSVSPSEGEPGTTVTITGLRFTDGSTVQTSGGPTSKVQIVSNTSIVVTLPNYNDIENPSSLLKQTFSIWVTDSQGRTAVGYHSFTIDIKLNANLLNAIGVWIKGHWYAVAIFGVVVIVLSVAIRKCCKEKKPEGYDSDA